MATKKKPAAGRLHLLAARQVLTAGEGDHSDGGGLLLRVHGSFASWGLRFTSPVTGKRREMGLGTCHRGGLAHAGDSLTGARDLAHKARELLRNRVDPLTHREGQREAGREAEAARKAERARDRWTLARCARDYHERVIEPTRTTKHAAQWISSLENHMPTALWHLPVADVTAPALLEALGQIKPHDRARNLTQGDRIAETMQRIAAAKLANAATPDTHDYSEAETRDYFIDLLLKEAGWQLDPKKNFEIEVAGMPNEQGKGFVDYVLWGDDGKPLALVEAKRTKKGAKEGQQQAKLYADCLEKQYGQRPVVFCSNGYEHWIWDDAL